jgi:RHS repeat-associated protein
MNCSGEPSPAPRSFAPPDLSGSPTAYYLHADALGSTRLVMTSTPSVQFSSNYRPYGLTYSMTGSETFKYTGKMYDGVTGLYYFNARWYDASTGRLITQDSYPGSRTDPLSLNRYVYARDDPERYVDPTGHGMHIMITDGGSDDPSDQIKTTSSCVGGVCTNTTTEVSGGYYSQISTTYGASNEPSGMTAYDFSTTFTDRNPSGITTSTTFPPQPVLPRGAPCVRGCRTGGERSFTWGQIGALTVDGLAIFSTVLLYGSSFADPLLVLYPDVGATAGTAGAIYYTWKNWNNPDISFGAAAEAYEQSFFFNTKVESPVPSG